jgi:hypothetical protein
VMQGLPPFPQEARKGWGTRLRWIVSHPFRPPWFAAANGKDGAPSASGMRAGSPEAAPEPRMEAGTQFTHRNRADADV